MLFPFNDLERHKTILFANYSFPESVRNPEVPDYFQDSRFLNQIRALHESAHDRTKEILHLRSRGKRKNKGNG